MLSDVRELSSRLARDVRAFLGTRFYMILITWAAATLLLLYMVFLFDSRYLRLGRAVAGSRLTAIDWLPFVLGTALLAIGVLYRVLNGALRQEQRIRESLLASEARFRSLVEATSDWVWELGADGRYTFVGPRAQEILGRTPHDLLGTQPKDLLRRDVWARIKAELAPYIRAGLPFPMIEVEIDHPSGRIVYLESTGLPVFDAAGVIQGYRGVDRDITGRILAQEALRRSELRLAEAQAVAHLGSGEWDLARGQFTWSRGVYRILELSPTDVQPSFEHYWACIPPAARPSLLRFCAKVRVGRQPLRYEHPLVFPDGSEKCVQVRVRTLMSPEGRPIRFIGTMQDITEQKQIEQRLRESEGRLWAAVEHVPVLFHAFDASGRFVVWNREWAAITGYSKAMMLGPKSGLSRLFPREEQRIAFWEEWSRADCAGQDREWDVTCADGSVRTVLWTNIASAYPIAGWASWGIGVDITERRRLDAERNLLMAAIEQALENVVIADTDGRVQYSNPAFERNTGYRREEMVNKLPQFFELHNGAPSPMEAILPQLQRGDAWQGRMETRRKDGSTFFEDVSIFPMKDADGSTTNLVKLGRDVTREIQLQADLQQRQKLEALGTLAGGLAHDFNNLLMPIMGFAELVMDRMATDDTNRSYLKEILSASGRARDIVRQMLTFSRQGAAECQPVQLGMAVRDALRLMRASIPSTVSIVEDVRTNGELVWADPTHIHQILMNMCTNAYHAMQRSSGRIEVVVECIVATKPMEELYPPLKMNQSYLRIRVVDDGCGMEPATVARIFDPFFTTKPLGQGTGLGLATVHGIVSGLKGTILVQSEPNKGTEFTVYLPEYHPSAIHDRLVQNTVPLGRGERIMLVDDEASVLNTTRQLLIRLGYDVTATESSEDALNRIVADPAQYDLVLTDQTMPVLTGADLATAVRLIRQDLPVVLATGFSESILPESIYEIGLRSILRKPYSKQELAQFVHDALEPPPEVAT